MAAVKKEFEKVSDEPKSVAEISDGILAAIKDFYYSTYEVESLEEISKKSNNTFTAALAFARSQCINRNDLLIYVPHQVNQYGAIAQNEAYDCYKVEQLAELYLNICFMLDKLPSIYAFSALSGIDRTVMQGWLKEEDGVTSADRYNKPKRAVQKIVDARSEFLQGAAASGGKSTIGSIAILNNTTWKNSAQTVSDNRRALPVWDVPDLSRLEIPDLSKSNENNII